MYAPDMGAPKYIKQKLTEKEKQTVTQLLLGTSVPHLQQWIDHSDAISKETEDLNSTVDQVGLTDHSVWKQQNTLSSWVHVERFLGLSIC